MLVMPESDQDVEALSILFSNSVARLSSNSDRQFTITLQILSLNIAVLAGVAIYTGDAEVGLRIVVAIALLALNVAAVWYIIEKAGSYWESKSLTEECEAKLREITGLQPAEPRDEQQGDDHRASRDNKLWSLTRGSKGSLFFVLAIAISGIVSAIGVVVWAAA
jgi:hypothetical protein